MNGYFGIEAGQSGVGDIFLWLSTSLYRYGATQDDKFKDIELAAASLKPGERPPLLPGLE